MKELKWGVEPFNAAEWDDLNDSSNTHPHLHSINVQLLLKHFGTGKERVWVCRRGKNAVAMTIVTGRLKAQTWHPSNQSVGLWVQQDDVDFADLVRTLARRFVMLSITHLDPAMLRRPAEEETVDYIETARTEAVGTFDDYWKARPSSLKENIRRYGNRLKRDNITPHMEVVTDPATIGEAVNAFGLLESAGWKGANAVHPDNAQGAYYRDLLTAFAANGWASVWQCYYGGKLVASNLLIHREGTVISLKITYDESHAKTSPSLLLRYEMFRHLWPHTDAIEYYGQKAGWHGWTEERRNMYHVNAYRSLLVQVVRNMVRRLKQRTATAAVVPESA